MRYIIFTVNVSLRIEYFYHSSTNTPAMEARKGEKRQHNISLHLTKVDQSLSSTTLNFIIRYVFDFTVVQPFIEYRRNSWVIVRI